MNTNTSLGAFRWPTVVLAAIAVLMVGCGKNQPAAAAKTDLTITVISDEGAAPKVMTLTCDPAGGSHPQPAEACSVLDKAKAAIFDPVPKDLRCTMIYGGPQTATVKGTYQGDTVDATFSRTNGCEIGRWAKLGTTFFTIPLQ